MGTERKYDIFGNVKDSGVKLPNDGKANANRQTAAAKARAKTRARIAKKKKLAKERLQRAKDNA